MHFTAHVGAAISFAALTAAGMTPLSGVAASTHAQGAGCAVACTQLALHHVRVPPKALHCATITTSVSYGQYSGVPFITVSGTNFAPDSSVTVTIQSQPFPVSVSRMYTTTSSGTFTSDPIQFGFIRQPSYLPTTITATDSTGMTAITTVP